MLRKFVQSSDLRSVGYEGGTLEIEFHSGGLYQFYGISEIEYKNLLNASSLGQYFHYNIKNKYTYRKIS